MNNIRKVYSGISKKYIEQLINLIEQLNWICLLLECNIKFRPCYIIMKVKKVINITR